MASFLDDILKSSQAKPQQQFIAPMDTSVDKPKIEDVSDDASDELADSSKMLSKQDNTDEMKSELKDLTERRRKQLDAPGPSSNDGSRELTDEEKNADSSASARAIADKRAQDRKDDAEKQAKIENYRKLLSGVQSPTIPAMNNLFTPPPVGMGDLSAQDRADTVPPASVPVPAPKPDEENSDNTSTPTAAPPVAPPQVLSLANTQRAMALPSPDIAGAIRQSQKMDAYKMMAQGAERIGAGMARQKHDTDYLKDMDTNQPIENMLNAQKIQSSQDAIIAQRRLLALNQDKDDPTSKSSNIYRKVMRDSFPDIFKGVDADKLSATQMEQVFPPLKSFAEAQLARETKTEIAGLKNEQADENRNTKKEKDFDSAYSKFIQQVNQVRGDKALNNQKDTIRRVDNAFMIINNPIYKGNPDNIPSDKAAIVVKDLDSIVSGGASTQEGFKDLANKTVYSKLAQEFSNVANKPTGAKLGLFIKQNQAVLQDLRQNAVNSLKHKYDNLDATLGRHLRPEDRQISKDSYYKEFLGIDPSIPGAQQQTNNLPLPAQEEIIKTFMSKNTKLTRDQAISILKDNGRL
jgi:hypothetical protein